MGAKIKGAGSSQIEIEGVKQLKDVSYNIMSDRIEAGTFLCIAAMNHSNIIVKNIDEDHIIPIIDKLEEAGCELQIEDRQIQIKAPKKLKSVYKNNAISRISNRYAINICNIINNSKGKFNYC